MDYQEVKDTAPKKGEQLSLLQYGVSGGTTKYKLENATQNRITQSIVEDLVVDCAMPLSLVEKPSFQRFMLITHERYRMMGR